MASFDAFNPAAIGNLPRNDYSWLAKLPQAFWQGQEVGRENELRDWIKANPNAPIEEVAKHLMAADPVRGSQLLQSVNNQNALNAYRTESLKPEVVRLADALYPEGGNGTSGPSSVPGTALVTPNTGGAMQLGPDGRPTRQEFIQSQLIGKTLTPAQKAVDTTFAKDYGEWVSGGGYAGIKKTQEQLKQGINTLNSGRDDISGPWMGLLPEMGAAGRFAQNQWFPDSKNVQQQIEEAIQTNLRRVLGSQYTQQEGENLLKRTYDPSLPEAVNAQRAQRVLDNLDQMAQAKDQAAKYYEQHGTLQGWQGSLLTSQDQIEVGDGGKNPDRLSMQGDYDAAQPSPPNPVANAGVGTSKYNTEEEAVRAAGRDRGSAAEGVGAPPPPPPNMLGRLRTAIKAHPEAEEEIKAAFERAFGKGQRGYADHYIYGEGR